MRHTLEKTNNCLLQINFLPWISRLSAGGGGCFEKVVSRRLFGGGGGGGGPSVGSDAPGHSQTPAVFRGRKYPHMGELSKHY